MTPFDDLFDDDPWRHARSGDPWTSHAAAREVKIAKQAFRVYLVYPPAEEPRADKPKRTTLGLTAEEAYDDAEMDIRNHGARCRCSDLRKCALCIVAAKKQRIKGILPKNAEECAQFQADHRLPPHSFSPLIAPTGETRPTKAERRAEVCRITPFGWEFLMGFPGFPGIPNPYYITNGDGEVTNIKRPAKGRSRSTASKARGCDNCTLRQHWPNLTTSRMPIECVGDGGYDPDVLILGEAPGEIEDREGHPFVGPSGSVLRRALPHRQRDRMALGNIVRCRPPGNRDPSVGELHACSQYLEEDIAGGAFKAILGLGAAPLGRFLTGASITQVHGLKFPVEIAGKVLWYYPTLHPAFLLHTGGEQRRGQRDESPAQPVFEAEIAGFFRDLDSWPEPHIERPSPDDVILARSRDEAVGWCAKLQRGKPVGFDIETDQLRPQAHSAEVMTAAVSDGVITVAWPVRHPDAPNNWGLDLALDVTENLCWVAHSAQFELAWLYHSARRLDRDWEPRQGYDCSLAAARLYQKRHSCLNLGILTRIYTGTDIKTLSQIDVANIRKEKLSAVLPYNGLDAWGSWRVFDQLGRAVAGDAYQSLIDTIASTTDMQLTGLDTDQDAANQLHQEWQSKAQVAEQHAQTVHEVRLYCRDQQREFRLGSDSDLGEVLTKYSRLALPRNRDGSWKTDDSTMLSLAPDHPLVKDALAFRHARKMDGTYVSPIIEAPTRMVDGRCHPSYSVALTKTLRLSAEDPSIQNWPKRADRELRRPIVPRPGHIFASADFKGLEARVYACASRDKELIRTTIAHEDIHRWWLDYIIERYPPYLDRLAARVTPNDTEEQIRQGGRDICKGDLVFASFYGATAKNVAQRASLPDDIAYDILGYFWQRYAGAADWLRGQRRLYRDTGEVSNLQGVVRADICWGNEPINTPIQSTAARLVLDCQNELHQMAKREKDLTFLPRINIHDDLTFEIEDDPEMLAAYIEIISRVLVKVRYRWQIVPLAVDWSVGYNWADLHKCHSFEGDYVGS